ncbi:LysR family transcriptional regulator [Bradyrhizobium japonicum]|jgi:DNA-binding transcriptional LysR family regulator|uniref:LysR family transcriptional regulator n=1 Tax=Bradyrhizobium japonicum TaxID=375 RepID=UPI0004B2A594|nr:LysR family transcriptional regulator [Bradyrhizobium japonicum]MBR0727206.1 LysR family transcriptional regulator [Bradyrhizobium japonicum]MBR0805368.1 LysR family transcriptional regulator [Bradyrhizobium japonicum]MCP1767797.1 DNA-binding transcriptional LysR family regulator [Bradyrhizobium japonicum]MCP1789939.1 DNA-binding transcriptional LysR family regulator [Bradyrhizobium japonicum]MCP1802435.1 DNA-binding transcriptional LysR family regulator [Bradyrhizobium japonicum]
MEIRELRYFAAVYRERNLTAAARACFVSQPSISTAITHLEAELGTTLFIRHKKGVAPTASAEQFHTLARRIIDEADAARSLFRKPNTKTTVTLGLMRTLDVPRTIALLKPLTARADIALRLVGSDERADARIISKSMLRADEHFVALWSERYVAALPPSHPLTLKEKLRTADLAGVPLIDRCHCEQSEFFGRSSQRRQTAAIAQSEDWAMALVAAGVGIAIVPEGAARGNPDVTVREIEVKVRREVGLAYRASVPLADALKEFVGKLQKQRRKPDRIDPRRNKRRKS